MMTNVAWHAVLLFLILQNKFFFFISDGLDEIDLDEKKISLKSFKNKKFLYNPSNKDNKCFLYCLAYFLYSSRFQINDKKSDELKLKKYVKRFNVKSIAFPISIGGINKFLKLNPQLDLKVNILFRQTDGLIYPYEYGLGKGKKIVNLLMVHKENKIGNAVNHFLLILNIDKYLRHVYQNIENNSRSYEKASYCLNCLNAFSSKRVLIEHERICCMNRPRLELMPENNEIKFKIFEKNTL